MASKSLHLFLLLALILIAPHVIVAHDHRLQFPEHLQGCRKGDTVEGIRNIKRYLQRYGYLRKSSNVDEESNAFDEVLELAIRTYQKNFNLNVSGVLDKGTLDVMSRPRCGVPDFAMSNNGGANGRRMWSSSHYALFPGNLKWPSTKYHLTYAFIHNYPSEYMAPVVRAMATWASSSQFTFAQALDVQTADIKVSFERGEHGDGTPFDGRGGILAHAFAPSDGRLHFDVDEKWTVGVVFNEFDVETVALHELGHVLGLAHSKIEAAIMWPLIDPGATKGLNPDDVDGIRALYA